MINKNTPQGQYKLSAFEWETNKKSGGREGGGNRALLSQVLWFTIASVLGCEEFF